MTTIREIFIDLDNVLNTLSPHVMRVFGCNNASNDYTAYPRECGYAVHAAVNSILGTDYTPRSFWTRFPYTAWMTAPRTPFAVELINLCGRLVGQANVYVATSPTRAPSCAAGKMEWMHKYLPEWLQRQFLITPCKHLVANPNALLLDDYDENIDKFASRGGNTITVPRPWNNVYDRDPYDYIKQQLETFQYENTGNEQC